MVECGNRTVRFGRMSSIRLSTTSYVVLGLIGLRGPSTPYDLKRAVEHSVGYFWPFPHAQLYAEPDRLCTAGLITMRQEDSGRRRKVYSLTDLGRSELAEWLHDPVCEPLQIRNIAELKLFFGELGEPADLRALAVDQVRIHRERLDELRQIERRAQGRDDRTQRFVPLALGVRLEQAALDFWLEQLADPPA